MRAVVHQQLRAHPPCPTQRPQPPPHSKTHTAPPTAPHTAPAPAPTHHKAHSHADSNCESNAPLRPSSRRPTRRRRTRRHGCAPASAPAWPPAPPCWCALRPASWQAQCPRRGTRRFVPKEVRSGGNITGRAVGSTFRQKTLLPKEEVAQIRPRTLLTRQAEPVRGDALARSLRRCKGETRDKFVL